MHYTYMVQCGDGTLYTGYTTDVVRRTQEHNRGKGAKYTRGRGPLKLRYRETAADKSAALKRGCALKRLRKKEKMAIILRYYRGLTQDSAAKILGISQVQVSRIEKKVLLKMRERLKDFFQ